MPKRYSKETKEKAREMRALGLTYTSIAEEIGCTAPCVRYWCDWKARAENHQRMSVRSTARTRRMETVEQDKGIIIALYSMVAQYNEQHDASYEVDHIRPAHLGGIHCITNLRITPMSENRTGRPRKVR